MALVLVEKANLVTKPLAAQISNSYQLSLLWILILRFDLLVEMVTKPLVQSSNTYNLNFQWILLILSACVYWFHSHFHIVINRQWIFFLRNNKSEFMKPLITLSKMFINFLSYVEKLKKLVKKSSLVCKNQSIWSIHMELVTQITNVTNIYIPMLMF